MISRIGNVTFDEFDVMANPSRFAFSMRLRLEIVENANAPAFAFQQVGYVRTDQAGATRHQSTFAQPSHKKDSLGQIRARPSLWSSSERNPRVAGAAKPRRTFPFVPKSSWQRRCSVTRSSTSYQAGNR